MHPSIAGTLSRLIEEYGMDITYKVVSSLSLDVVTGNITQTAETVTVNAIVLPPKRATTFVKLSDTSIIQATEAVVVFDAEGRDVDETTQFTVNGKEMVPAKVEDYIGTGYLVCCLKGV